MSEIVRYVVVNEADEWIGEEHDDMQEAQNAAESADEPCAVLRVTYTYDDSELWWAPNGGQTWPPSPDVNED